MSLVGKLHLLVIHFPIALVLAAAGAEIVAIGTRRREWSAFAALNVRAGAAMAMLTTIAGWVLASAPFVSTTPALESHRWAGVVASVATLGAAGASSAARLRSRGWLAVY